MKAVQKIAITCETCHRVFDVFPSQVGHRRFCSKPCHNLWMSQHPKGTNRYRTERMCEFCLLPFLAKDKRGRWCFECVDPTDPLATSLARNYGLTVQQYNTLVTAQGNRCKLCKAIPTGSRNFKRLHVDHDHKTDRIRGLLCPKCNSTVGFVETHPHIQDVIGYLMQPVNTVAQ